MKAVTVLVLAHAGAATSQAAQPAGARPELLAAIRAGVVGERFDGYLGFASTPSPQVRRQAGAINIQRRALYTDLAVRRRVAPGAVGLATGCALLKRLSVGESYLLQDGVWRRRQAGQAAPQPAYCG